MSGFGVEYVFPNAVCESLGVQDGLKEGFLLYWGICRDGRRVTLQMTVRNKESLDAWL